MVSNYDIYKMGISQSRAWQQGAPKRGGRDYTLPLVKGFDASYRGYTEDDSLPCRLVFNKAAAMPEEIRQVWRIAKAAYVSKRRRKIKKDSR